MFSWQNQTDAVSDLEIDMRPKTFLYNPFLPSEGGQAVVNMQMKWQKTIANSIKAAKTPILISHCETSTPFADLPITKDSVIYITAHGGSSPLTVSSRDKTNNFEIDIRLIANRLRNDGFTPELAKQFKGIKLYVCDNLEISVTKYLAYNFAQALGNEYSFLTINYYVGELYNPTNFYNRPIKIGEILSPKESDVIIMCKAKEVRERTTVGNVLKMHAQLENPTKSTGFSLGNLFSALPSFSLFGNSNAEEKQEETSQQAKPLQIYIE